MSALDMLIKVKKQAKTDDLVQFLDEVADYEKLAKVEAFRDLRTSEAAKKKLPLLSGAYAGDLYSLTLLSMARNVIVHLDGSVPDILQVPEWNITKRDMKRLDLMEQSIISVFYYSLSDYNHEELGDKVVSVYTSKQKNRTAILIVVHEEEKYLIYEGFYTEDGSGQEKVVHKAKPYWYAEDEYYLSILTYSIQGNNAYPFAELRCPYGEYSVMLPQHDELWLIRADKEEPIKKFLDMGEINQLNIVKSDIGSFAKYVMELAKEGLEAENEEKEDNPGTGPESN